MTVTRVAEPNAIPASALDTIVHALRWRAQHHGAGLACRFLVDGDTRVESLSYAALDRRARAIAAALQQHDAARERVLLAFPPGLDFLAAWYGCMYAGAVAVVVPPSHPARTRAFETRAGAIVDGARPALALTTTPIRDAVHRAAVFAHLPDDRWLAINDALQYASGDWRDSDVQAGDTAFLQYTSGSTSAPRGVVVTHGNLIQNLRAIERCFGTEHDSVCWLPPHHDMGLVGGIAAPVYLGCPVTLLSPLSFVQRPHRWLAAVSHYGVAVSGGPNFAYELCARRVTAEQSAGLDLSGWRVAFCGGEPINAATLDAFASRFAPHGFAPESFKPCYGLAEATLLVSASAQRAHPRVLCVEREALARRAIAPCAETAHHATGLVSCGPPVAATLVVDPDTAAPCAPDRVGEIWVSGSSVASGYWRNTVETRRTFGAFVAGTGAGPYLRTGDLGFILDGELFITGRVKDLIIIDGANHYPQDIERTVGACAAELSASECAVFSIDVDGHEAVVVMAAVRTARCDTDRLRRVIRSAVSEQHDLRLHDAVFIAPRDLPKTTSGKIRRSACRHAYLTGTIQRREPA